VVAVSPWSVPLGDVRFSEAEVAAVADVYRSGWLSQGPRVAQFEAAFASYCGGGHAVAVSSATAALNLICVALGLGPGDEVVVPSLTFAATAAAVLQCGATPVFADIGPTPWASGESVAAVLTERTRAVITVGYGGHPGDVIALRALTDTQGLTLIEDAAHALGAAIGDRMSGTVGDAAAFSFFSNKNLPLGEGGMLLTADANIASQARLLRSHGISADTWTRHSGTQPEYEVTRPGFNYRLDEPRAALGNLMLARLDSDNAARADLASEYARGLEAIDGVGPAIVETAGVRCAWHIFPVLLDRHLDRAEFRARLASAGIQTSIHYPPLHLSPAFAQYARGPLPLTEEYAARAVTLPLFPHLTSEQQSSVLEAVALACGGVLG
jgi:dTDP-4-amino-4,6-dideoxygalactose transaminase